ncbi:MAG: cysteine--tRNA ligase [archaeon]
MAMTLNLYNTLSRKKEAFKPVKPGQVWMYVCGPTVYDLSHLGHARAYVAFDVIHRYLEYSGFKVVYIQNLTDVDDKIINRAKEEKIAPLELSKKYAEEYFKDMDSLDIERADKYPKASEHIGEMIKLIEKLIEKGYAYEAGGDVYFSVNKFKDYGKLSGMKIEEMEAGKRIEPSPLKDEPLDFALWKRAKEGEISWDSPWGKGRPGWHIECSAMSSKYLGETFDIHGGGQDLIFPHHSNEIAQAECATGKKFVKYWLHNGFITVNKAKMSKSLKNFSTIRELLKRYDAKTIRFFLISTHYRSPIDFADVYLEQAAVSLSKLQNTYDNLRQALEKAKAGKADEKVLKEFEKVKKEFKAAMDDDFNTSIAMSKLFDLSKILNKQMEGGNAEGGASKATLKAGLETLEELDSIFKILKKNEVSEDTEHAVLELARQFDVKKKSFKENMKALIDLRETARREKDYGKSDEIRKKLEKLGIILEDGKDGARWRINN